MNDVIRIVERIQLVPGAYIDCSFRQGRDAVLAQVRKRPVGERKDTSVADQFIVEAPEYLASLHKQVAPYRLPDDYVFFLEFYGGGLIKTTNYNLLMLGIGPMVEEWYGFALGDDAMYENGLLLISTLVLWGKKKYDYVEFFLDLAGNVHQFCVVGIPSGGIESLDVLPVVQDLNAYPTRWAKLTNSFTEWLEQAATTQGAFGYV